MAYRTFENQPTYAAPDIDILPRSLALLQTANQQRAAQNQAKRNLAATYKADQLASKFTTDQDDLNHLTKEITQNAMRDIMTTGTISPQTKEMQGRAVGYKNQSDAQWEMSNKARQSIKDKAVQNKYYMPDADLDMVNKADYGEDTELVNFNNRGERLQSAISSIGTDYLKTFNKDLYDSDYVNNLKTQQRESSVKGENGIKNGSKVEAIFLDSNGKPVVTDEHAIDYLDSSPELKKYYDQSLMSTIKNEAKQIKASGAEWTAGKSEDQIATELINNPSRNSINQNSFGARQRDMAKSDLERKQRQNISTSYDASDKPIGSQYGVTAKNVSAAPSFNPNGYSGPGLSVRKNIGTNPMIPINVSSPSATNTVTGEVSNNKEPRQMMLDQVLVVGIKSDGSPVNIQATDINDFKEKYQKLSPEEKNKIVDVRLAATGKAYNKRGVLDAANTVREKQESIASTSSSETERAEAQRTLGELDKMVRLINLGGEGVNTELMQSLIGPDIIRNEIVPFGKTDPSEYNISQIKTATGSDLSNKKNWTPEMKDIDQFLKQKITENQINQDNLNKSSVVAPKNTATKLKIDKTIKDFKPKSSYSTDDGKSYSMDDLLKSYTKEQVNQLIKGGILK